MGTCGHHGHIYEGYHSCPSVMRATEGSCGHLECQDGHRWGHVAIMATGTRGIISVAIWSVRSSTGGGMWPSWPQVRRGILPVAISNIKRATEGSCGHLECQEGHRWGHVAISSVRMAREGSCGHHGHRIEGYPSCGHLQR